MKRYMKKISVLLVVILLLQTGCSKNRKIDWEQMIRRDFFASESIVEQAMADEVSFKITPKENQLVVNVNAPNISDELLGWMESVSDAEFNEVAMEQEILRLLKECPKTDMEFILNCSINDEEVEIAYTAEFVEAITCGMTHFCAEVTQQILEETGDDAQENDSYKYGDAVKDRALGGMKEEYTKNLKKIFAKISHLREENSSTSELKAEDYQCQHSYSEYEDLLTTMEICFWDKTFESLDTIQDLDMYFSCFVTWDYPDEVIEQWHDETNLMYEIPGDVFRNTMCKHFAFDQIKMEEYFPGSPGENPYDPWYDVENDVYHGWIGGFGGPHDGFDELKIEVLEYGIIKATSFWKMDDGTLVTSSIIVEESANGDMRLKAYTHEETEATDESMSQNTQNPTVVDTTKGEVTLTGTLEFRTAESSSGNGYVKEMYILHLDPPIEELIYYDYDSEDNAMTTGIAEMDVSCDLGGIKGQYHGYKLTITGEIYPNYTAHYFTYFRIVGEEFTIH